MKKDGTVVSVSAMSAVISLLAGLLWGAWHFALGACFMVLVLLPYWLAFFVLNPALWFLFALWLIFVRPRTLKAS